jgi:hypothetical protein
MEWLLPCRAGRNYASGTRDARLLAGERVRPSVKDIQLGHLHNRPKVKVKQLDHDAHGQGRHNIVGIM